MRALSPPVAMVLIKNSFQSHSQQSLHLLLVMDFFAVHCSNKRKNKAISKGFSMKSKIFKV